MAVDGWRDSGLSAQQYARRHDLPVHRLEWWARRQETESPLRLVPVELVEQQHGEAHWEVHAHDGARLVVYGELTPALAECVVAVLVGDGGLS